ncbi:DeoR/GlpR family DNA-binding transcription regulator [Oceanobacillus manasiensis]|uniref:DeoR/GlpR family DNA-binding transcription regulator n=1 Tax=Oceanobacillus manasiensis TaxID=586413 RepID=UPI000A826F4A|nr:DeoR/GlpR family DNA-binding transcription regulator [Oceanobacillus manasiensis]
MGSTQQRRDWLLKRIDEDGKVLIERIADSLKVSPMTIRRDLKYLESTGKVIRIHGGAVSTNSLVAETPYKNKESLQINQKKSIANKALSFVQQGQTIILDAGTTNLELAKLLKKRENITVITNDIKIATELVDCSLKVIVTGGELQQNVGTLYGPQTYNFIKDLHVDLLFLGAHAVDMEAGVTSPTLEKSLVKKLMIDAAETSWLIADSSKLNQKAFSKVCDLSQVYGLLTDDDISVETKKRYSNVLKVL